VGAMVVAVVTKIVEGVVAVAMVAVIYRLFSFLHAHSLRFGLWLR
jgi:uncharacterized membrane protein YcaP (DUF421 family)